MPRFAPILPGPLTGPRNLHGHISRIETLPRQRNVSVACRACQQGRRKCSGGHPCVPCQDRKVDCTFAADRDGRRQEARKRKLEDLEADSQLLYHIVHIIQRRDDKECAQIVSLIRSDLPLDEVKLRMKRQISSILDSDTVIPPPKARTLAQSERKAIPLRRVRSRMSIRNSAHLPTFLS